ncbi:PHD finger protein 7-like [Cyrtonyx montezumae]|uniref:PHD finger protein 7-like n=1 Tax=Cyrtonyx montezumae TaxID=9017 RepID=UPI0032D9C42E
MRCDMEHSANSRELKLKPAREENGVDALHLLQRHDLCNAMECFHPKGRDQAEEEESWQLILCSSCAAQSTHRWCSCTCIQMENWDCDICAGLGTSSITILEFAGQRTATQEGLVPSHSFQDPEDTRYGPASQAASDPLHSSQLTKISSHIRAWRTQRGTLPSYSPEDTSERHRGRCGSRETAAPRAESCSHTPSRRKTSRSTRESPATEYRFIGS